jgi:hypothetical protein
LKDVFAPHVTLCTGPSLPANYLVYCWTNWQTTSQFGRPN